MKHKKIGASILSADFANLGEAVSNAEKAQVDYIHVDIMDGNFVQGITWGPGTISSLKQYTSLPLDVHLMVDKPERTIDQYIESGPNSLSIHVEATHYSRMLLRKIKSNGIKPGIALKLDTPISSIENIIDLVDFVLLLTSEEGFGGNKFTDLAYKKISQLESLVEKENRDIEIQVDGGVNLETLPNISKTKVTQFVMGSAIYNKNDIHENIKVLRNTLM